MDYRFEKLYIESGLKVKDKVRDMLFANGVGRIGTRVDLPNKILLMKITQPQENIMKKILKELPNDAREDDFIFI